MRRPTLLAAGVLLLTWALPACGSDDDGYCDAVDEHQQELSVPIGVELFEALDVLRDIRDQAPADIAEEWQTYVGSIEAFDEAFEAAGVDPVTYDPRDPPPGVKKAEQQAIRAGARGLTSGGAVQAHVAVDRHVRDVCGTGVSLP